MREKIEKLERARQLSPKLAASKSGHREPGRHQESGTAVAMDEDDNDYGENGWWKEDEEDEEEVSWETTYQANRQAPKTPGRSTLATFWKVPLPSPSSNMNPSHRPYSPASPKQQHRGSIGPKSRYTQQSVS